VSFWQLNGVAKSSITFFSWAALGYSFKFVWAPLVDRLPLPFLTKLLGRRRSWMLFLSDDSIRYASMTISCVADENPSSTAPIAINSKLSSIFLLDSNIYELFLKI
jgi:PAT family beta-lactamase induction signal transducer AmpG